MKNSNYKMMMTVWYIELGNSKGSSLNNMVNNVTSYTTLYLRSNLSKEIMISCVELDILSV